MRARRAVAGTNLAVAPVAGDVRAARAPRRQGREVPAFATTSGASWTRSTLGPLPHRRADRPVGGSFSLTDLWTGATSSSGGTVSADGGAGSKTGTPRPTRFGDR
jgi:hypothetical protein